jgi:hypothetical protein
MAGEVARKVHMMQAGLWLRAKAHKARGERSVQWMKEREAERPWLQHVLLAWKAAKGRTGGDGLVAAQHTAGPAVATSAAAMRAERAATTARRVAGNVSRLVSYGRLVLQREVKRDAALRRWRLAGEAVRRRVVARRRLQAALGWARRMVLRARVRQMLARRAVRTTTAVDTIHSMGSNQLDSAAATTTPAAHAATGTRRQVALHNAARAGVRVMALVRSCETSHTGENIAATATNTANTATKGIYNG